MSEDKLTYADAGVDISTGEKASRAAYQNAKTTFGARVGKIGAPVEIDGGFSGALDFGDFYLIQNDDGTGTKSEIAERMKKYDTLGEDLLAMVADDAICVGAECVSVTNTFDVPKVDPAVIDQMTRGLAEACQREKIVIPGGEIAEVPGAATKIIWNATAVGVVKKEKFITGQTIHAGQAIIGLKGRVLRSNGFSLARKICENNFGKNWETTEWQDGISWGEILLTPSKTFHRIVLDAVLGDFESERKFDIAGIVHVTGGGIPGNLPRIFPKKSLGAELDALHDPHPAVKELQKLGNIDETEAYRTWHCGTAMLLICEETAVEKICAALNERDSEIEAKRVGTITESGTISIASRFSGERLSFGKTNSTFFSMKFQFQTGDVTFFDEDKTYFEKRFEPLKKYMGDVSQKDTTDPVFAEIRLEKTKHRAGNRFIATANLTCKNLGTLRAEATAENIRKLADLLHDNFKTQASRGKDKLKDRI
ncbi:MAG: phosphoribosylformylglycinamidine cyclo-ligase [Candidatus Gracilibacteria bacterium]|nr:phosphoribosylformylglycinamidine cyclo-ligase [Candidatus Gracilibacteria bacterium]